MKNKIIMKEVSILKCYENNPRHNEQAVDKVAESIKTFGFLVPIVIDTNDTIVAGETRLKASIKLGLEEVPCIIASDLTEDQLKAFRLVENKTSEFATWDFERLKEEIKGIDLDIDIFDFPDLNNLDMDISDDDFLQDTEIVKNRDKKTVICPDCGKEFLP